MQGSGAQQNMESGVKSTSTPEMLKLLVISAVAAVVQAVVLLGWITAKVDAGIIQVGFIGLDPPITSIVFFAALFCIPTALATPLVMFTHWKPEAVLIGSQQLTDSLRGQFAAPFRMKYLYGVQAFINGVALISLKYQFFWPVALNMLNIALYGAGLALVFMHFQRPNVPTDLASTAGSMIGGTVDVGRLDALERDVKTVKQELEELKIKIASRVNTSSDVKLKQATDASSDIKLKQATAVEAPSAPAPTIWGAFWGSKGKAEAEETTV